jgi:hypothetical protein
VGCGLVTWQDWSQQPTFLLRVQHCCPASLDTMQVGVVLSAFATFVSCIRCVLDVLAAAAVLWDGF